MASVTATFVEPHRVSGNIGTDFVTTVITRKRFRQLNENPPMTTSLQVLTYSNSSKPCDLAGYVNADDADCGFFVNKDQRIVA